ncbi:MAG: tRNA (adenosine(37)-N6)-threonylcarbamoyltransferase complex dimerization subunit type 1 TsaB [Candidatus Nanopelagicales bacterium]|nr:tRNA (adenosine(37)-N6)-threonylcarbamoyltransferase complex dimerization subunit type 1 TsaB [Candidatus Nanopelagicales bacterium]
MILAIDTSTPITSVAVADGDEVLAAASHDDARGHAEVIGGLVERVLAQAGVVRTEMVACGVGPGPYTGLRVGISFARALALAWGVPVHGVCSLDAVAFAIHSENKAGGHFAVALDARRREVFWAKYDAAGDRELGPLVQRPADIDPAVRALLWCGRARASASSLWFHGAGALFTSTNSCSSTKFGSVAEVAARRGSSHPCAS